MSYKATHLLVAATLAHKRETRNFSKQEILKHINEIKYLAKQKNVPKLSLQKKIVHLEQKVESIFELEKKLLTVEKRESAKEKALKREIATLKKRLAHANDPHLHKKVSKLSHLIGHNLAMRETAKYVEHSDEIVKSINATPSKQDVVVKVQALKNLLKNVQAKDPARAAVIATRIAAIERKLTFESEPQQPQILPPPQKTPIVEKDLGKAVPKIDMSPREEKPKHTILFGKSKQKASKEPTLQDHIEKSLPLPPPPKIEKKK